MKIDKPFIKLAFVCVVILLAITIICATIFLNQKIEYSCNSGKIDINLLMNTTDNQTSFQHLELKGIEGLTCNGKFPLGVVSSLGFG